jgi:hypothetical protein
MPYVGRSTDKISNIEVLDNITFDGSSSYSITKGSVAFTPNSAQSLLISIDGVVQATNFSVTTSTIDFGVAIPSTSTCDFFLHYGTGVLFTPADGTVTEAKIGSNAVTTAKIADDAVTEAKLSALANPFASQLIHVQDQKASGTSAGDSVVGYQFRDLNTIVTNEITGASLSSNAITLPAGTYYIEASTPAYRLNQSRISLYNNTTSNTILLGKSGYANNTYNGYIVTDVKGRFTLGSTTALKIRQYVITDGGQSSDLGVNIADGSINIYTEVLIWRIA